MAEPDIKTNRFRIYSSKCHWLFILAGLCFIAKVSGSDTPKFLSKDANTILDERKPLIYNGNMELGVAGRAMPGYSLQFFLNRQTINRDTSTLYLPLTRKDKDGNQYLEVPGYKGAVEYKLETELFHIQKDGEVELSFSIKADNDETGKLHPDEKIILDFRCKDLAVQYGTVKQKYPILLAETITVTKEWKKHTYKFQVKGGESLEYKVTFRVAGEDTVTTHNALCIDDMILTYTTKNPGTGPEAAFTADKELTAYNYGTVAKYTLVASLPSKNSSEKIKAYLRTDYENEVCGIKDTILVAQKGSTDKFGRSVFKGDVSFAANRYGSFNIITEWNGRPLPSAGGSMVVLHKLPEKASKMQRKIGANYGPDGYYGLTPSDESCIVLKHAGVGRKAEVFALSGFRNAFYSFTFKALQPEIDKLDFSLPEIDFPLFKKYDIEPIPCIGSGTYHQRKHKRGNLSIGHAHTSWYYKSDKTYNKIKNGKTEIRYLPPEKAWDFLINGLSKRYGQQITKWAIFREPQWTMTAKDLFYYQKTACEILKRDNPKAEIIGCNATSDAGNQLTDWVEQLEKLGIRKYQDYLSFHPYQSGLDYQSGVRFRFSNLVRRLREIMPGEPLWNTELYYIPNSKRKQYEGAQSDFSSGDVQRHYMLCLLNDLAGVSAINAPATLYKDYLNPNHICAALNTVSAFLADKDEHIKVTSGNKLIRTGIFAGKDKSNCSAVLWALQPSGASLTPTVNAGSVVLYDTFGNKIKWDNLTRIPLRLDPIFLTGSLEDLKNLLEKGNYSMGKPIILRARTFKGEGVFYEAQNLSGSENIVNVNPKDNCPPLHMHFKDNDYIGFEHPGEAATSYSSGVDGETEMTEDQTLIIKNTGEYIIPASADKPVELTASEGSKISFWTDSKKLYVKAEVKDRQVTAAGSANIFDGDAIELFIDRTPFKRLDLDQQGKSYGALGTKQFVFAAKEPKEGKSVIARDTVLLKDLDSSKASAKTELARTGYTMTMEIPLTEITPLSNTAKIIGIYLEICRTDGTKRLPKETLFKLERASYKYRFHYPLFRIDSLAGNLLENGNAESGLKNWAQKSKLGVILESTDKSFSGKSAVMTKLKELPEWGPNLKRGMVTYVMSGISSGTYKLVFYATGKDLEHMKIKIAGAEPLKNALSTSKAEIMLKAGDVPIENKWTKYDFLYVIPKNLDKAAVAISFVALRDKADAYAIVDDCSLIKINDDINSN